MEEVAGMAMPPIVGRELDLALGLEQLKRVQSGGPAALLVRGVAGIGKSRLVAELTARAQQLGFTVVVGRADDLDGGIPYAIFRDILVRLAGEQPHGDWLDEFRHALEGRDATRSEVDDNADLNRVFADGVQLFRRLAGSSPTVLVVEDLHLADRESLALVALLMRLADIPMLTVVTLRPGSARSAEIERLMERMNYDGRGSTIDLEPLDRHEVRALVASALSAVPDEPLGDAVFAASQGNPFFAREVVQLFSDGSAVAVENGRARLRSDAPAVGLRPSTALLQRLFGGSGGDVELAKVMAVFGRFPLRHLPLAARLTGEPPEQVTGSFDRLVKEGLVTHGATGGYEFIHSIVRDTLYDDIGPAERRRLHAAIATELAKDRRDGFVLDVLELAMHVAQSAEPGDVGAAEVMLEAGRAVAAAAPLVSADYLRRANDLLPVDSPLRATALAMQAKSLHVGCRPTEAAAVGRHALESLPPGPIRQLTVAIVVNDLLLESSIDAALTIIDDELVAGDPGVLLPIKTNLLFQGGQQAAAAAVLPEAQLSIAREPLHVVAATHLVEYANHVGRMDLVADLFARVENEIPHASPTRQLTLHEYIAFADWRPGLLRRIEEHLVAARALRPDPAYRSIGGALETAQVRLHLLRGQWDEALALVRSVSFDLEERGVIASAQLLQCVEVDILLDRGDLDAAAAMSNRVLMPMTSLQRCSALIRARWHHAVGDSATALEVLERERTRTAAGAATLWRLPDVLRVLIDVLLEQGRLEDARHALAELEELAATTGWPESNLPALRARALVEKDVQAAQRYAELATTEGWEVERAHAALTLGELGQDPGNNLMQAYRQFDSFGAAPLRRRAAAGLRARGLSVPRRAQAGTVLTDTEVQLIKLVRQALTNQQIATAMHYSTKTIEVYLSRIYVKTRCASRLELIRAVDTGALALSD